MYKIISITLLCFFISILGYGDKKPIDETAYGRWKRIDDYKLSDDGRWAYFRYLYFENDSLNKVTSKRYYLYDSNTDHTIIFENIETPCFFSNGQWFAYRREENNAWIFRNLQRGTEIILKRDINPDFDDKNPYINYDLPDNQGLVYRNLQSGDTLCYYNTSYLHQLDGDQIIFIAKEKEDHRLYYGTLFNPTSHKLLYVDTTKSLSYFQMDGEQGRFELKNKTDGTSSYYRFTLTNPIVELIYDSKQFSVELQKQILGMKMLRGNELIELEYRNPKQRAVSEKNTNLKDTTFELELWSWNDPKIPTEQEKSGYRNPRLKPTKYIYNIRQNSYYPIVTEEEASVYYPDCEKPNYAIICDETPYLNQKDWLYVSRYDNYIVDLYSGKKRLLAEKQICRPQWAPNGDYLIYYDNDKQDWILLNPQIGKSRSLRNEIGYPVHNELHDRANPASPYGIAAWSEEGDKVYIYDRFDIWVIDLDGKQDTYCLTRERGRKELIQIRFLNPNDLNLKISRNQDIAMTYNEWQTKQQGFGWISTKGKIEKKYGGFCMFQVGGQSDDGNYYLLARQSFSEGRDLWIYNSKNGEARRISDANPDHHGYRWGKVELVEWTNYEGKINQGVLYLPYNYDPDKSYPTIVSFYETHTNEMHTYFFPELSNAMLNIPTYLSEEYIVFQPDVYFEVGNPAQSSYNAVVSGTRALIKRGIIDSTRVGLQGHSWSGYQVSHLITQTDLFTCVNVGAPITNMVAGYTGIREGAGVPRMFMYEDWQCRMGSTLWENVDGYIRNSAIYYADRIHTPVLLFHCEKDEAVSFSDGRNLFLALRRLKRPAWLLNYKGEGHFVNSKAAQQDWTKRMQQFFDYYLKHTDLPRWMNEGISINERGFDQKYDLIDKFKQQITEQ